MNLGLLAKNCGNVEKALFYMDDAAKLVEIGRAKARLRLLVNRGICLLRLGQLAKARNSFLEAKSLVAEVTEPVFAIAIHNNLGHVYRVEGNHRTAEEFYAEALRLAEQSGDTERQACIALEFLGENCIEQRRLDVAKAYLGRALRLARKLAPQGDLMMEVLRRLGEAEAAMGNRDEALRHLERAVRLCASRGERREHVLAQRALAFAGSASDVELSGSIRSVLAELQALGDRFEYARTVVVGLEDGRIGRSTRWLDEAAATAAHYFNTMGLVHWRERLQKIQGHARNVGGGAHSTEKVRWVSRSDAFESAVESARLAARTHHPVLIMGETGAGKEIVAGLVHESGRRASKPLIAVNCGALPEHLVESELFGHVRGAFTSADRERVGLFEAADGGTVLLDEIADLPLQTQVKLLRFLDSGELRRLGETTARRANVRVISATNKPLESLVAAGTFRQDLYFRLRVFTIRVPPLRERRMDILDLTRHFLEEESQSSLPIRLAPRLEAWLEDYEWPGNVRELKHVCCYLAARGWGKPQLDVEDLPDEVRRIGTPQGADTLDEEKRLYERKLIAKALRESRGSIHEAAQLLGMGRNTIARRMKELGLSRDEFRSPTVRS